MADLNEIVHLDQRVIGNLSRREEIEQAIKLEGCLVAKDSDGITGFLIYHNAFFDHCFISLLIVSPNKRRRGHANSLLDYLVDVSPTKKIFSSTNRSNTIMQKVFDVNGFRRSGIIENLDEGDPELIYFKLK